MHEWYEILVMSEAVSRVIKDRRYPLQRKDDALYELQQFAAHRLKALRLGHLYAEINEPLKD